MLNRYSVSRGIIVPATVIIFLNLQPPPCCAIICSPWARYSPGNYFVKKGKGVSSLDKGKKAEIINQFRFQEGDTGSTEVQVALLTERINQLTGHMANNRHDYHSQRGLLKLVGRRRRLLAYLSRQDTERYHKLISRLGLRK